MNFIKKELNKTVDKLEVIIEEYRFIVKHSLFFVDEYFADLRNQVDIQREELLLMVNKFSQDILARLDTFHQGNINENTQK
jgi:hypothetical protein